MRSVASDVAAYLTEKEFYEVRSQVRNTLLPCPTLDNTDRFGLVGFIAVLQRSP
jgi:hypothetical protein